METEYRQGSITSLCIQTIEPRKMTKKKLFRVEVKLELVGLVQQWVQLAFRGVSIVKSCIKCPK